MKYPWPVFAGAILFLLTTAAHAQEAFPATHSASLRTISAVPSARAGRGSASIAADRAAGQIMFRGTVVAPGDTVTEIRVRKHTPGGDDPALLVIPYPEGAITVNRTLPVSDPAMYQALDSELVYLDLRSKAYPDGYMKGEVSMMPNAACLRFDASQMVPPVSGTSAQASGLLRADPAARQARYVIRWYGLDGDAIAVEIHSGRYNENGPVVATFTATAGSNGVVGTWANMTDENLRDLDAGMLYIVITSSGYPGGEVRGQLTPMDPFMIAFGPANVVPPANASAASGTGFAAVQRNIDGSVGIRLSAVFGGITDTVREAHVHRGSIGENGPAITSLLVQQGMFLFVDTNFLAGTMPADLLADLRQGRAYADIHTSQYPNGQLRGQFVPSAPVIGGVSGVGTGTRQPASFTATYDGPGRVLRYAACGSTGIVRIMLYAVTGSLVAEHSVEACEGGFAVALVPGLYFAQAIDANGVGMVARVRVSP